jgi:hypothetical protein
MEVDGVIGRRNGAHYGDRGVGRGQVIRRDAVAQKIGHDGVLDDERRLTDAVITQGIESAGPECVQLSTYQGTS